MPKNLDDFTPASGRMRKEDGNTANIADLIESLSSGALDQGQLEDEIEDVVTAVAFCTAAVSQVRDAVDEMKQDSLGQVGGKSITGTNAVTPDSGYYFFAIVPIAETVVAAQGDISGAINPDLTDFTALPIGVTLYGKWNSITLTSGEAVGYYRET